MDKKDALSIAKKYAVAVKTLFDCKEIFLFGSYVRGTQHEESDIDIAVILSEYENMMDTQLQLMRLRRAIDSRIEPHPFREKEFNLTDPVASDILKYGERIDMSRL